jgi:hypothetical protein
MNDLFISIPAIIFMKLRVGFVVEKLAVEQVFIQVFRLPSFAIIPPGHTTSFIYQRRYIVSETNSVVK